MLERKIAIGLITSTEYLEKLQKEWNPEYIGSATIKLIAQWCWEHFKKFGKAPQRDIELIYEKKSKKIDPDLAEELETDFLPELSSEFEQEEIDVEYLLHETREYFNERKLTILTENIESLIAKGNIKEAAELVEQFELLSDEDDVDNILDLTDEETVMQKVDDALNTSIQNVLQFPGALGDFMNDELVRGGFVAILAPEKRGKTWLLLDMMMRAVQQNRKVAFVQAGDMTEAQQLVRIAIYLARRSNKEKYCGEIYMPVVDCVKNQTDDCREKVRECDFGIFRERTFEQLKKQVPTKQELVEAYETYPEYKRCINCSAFKKHRWGTVWLQKLPQRPVLTAKYAKKLIKKFFIDAEKNVKIFTYANDTLTVSRMRKDFKKVKFEPEVILLDYPDLMVAETSSKEFRHQQNSIWKKLRGTSQELDCLIVAPTQSDSNAFEVNTLKLKNFSEDKRKYAHVTAFFSMNQDKEGIEKEIGLLRIGKLIARESDFHISQQVTVLQCIPIGRPVLDSYL